ncbi:unnamed protein product [Effrenium voratum]|uniref:C3H1-type domain-containing protein n=1 Tax=Effrenium voratum TaxID=2562239 RepID=A0AA36HQZ7_9DINO|nr:unnamed protein product [Effrenium voratum]
MSGRPTPIFERARSSSAEGAFSECRSSRTLQEVEVQFQLVVKGTFLEFVAAKGKTARCKSAPASTRGGTSSLGSLQHNAGCKPCAWYWKPGGCRNGSNCHHCHLCPQGELTRQRKMHRWSCEPTTRLHKGHSSR